MNRRNLLFSSLLAGMMLLSIVIPASAQDNRTVIQLGLPQFQIEFLPERIIEEFEAEHPNIQVELVPASAIPVSDDVEAYLDNFEELAMTADLIPVPSDGISQEVIRAGYLMDLSSVANSDSELAMDDFFAAALETYQRDGGLWGLPVAMDAVLLFYKPEAFDEAGLPYPDDNWTIYDFDNAIRTLTEFDENGLPVSEVLVDSFSQLPSVFISLADDNLYDEFTTPFAPDFDNAQINEILEVWAQLIRDGYLEAPAQTNMITIGGNQNVPPLQIASRMIVNGLGAFNQQASEPQVIPVLLPGGTAGIMTNGYGISTGTQHPQEAYELLKFLTSNVDFISSVTIGSEPARRSLIGAEPEADNNGPGGRPGFRFEIATTPEVEAAVLQGLENGLSGTELLFSSYLQDVLTDMVANDVSATDAMATVEDAIEARLTAADARAETSVLSVNPPDLGPILAPGEVELLFGVSSNISPLPNQSLWDDVADDFSVSDGVVGAVTIDGGFTNSFTEMAEEYDCFSMTTNSIASADLSQVLVVDPLMTSDPNFDRSDYISGVLELASEDGVIWAVPLVIQPTALRFNREWFDIAGVPYPQGTWTTTEFENALRSLANVMGEDDGSPFQSQGFDNAYLLSLIAAYGGLPLDYRTDPVTLNFTDPITVGAIQQVLDLAKEGLISYSALSTNGPREFSFGGDTPIYTDFGAGGGIRIAIASNNGNNDEASNIFGSDPQVAYPQGSAYTTVSYSITLGFISANTDNAEACYRWLERLANEPGIMDGMPVLNSLMSSDALLNSVGRENVAFYNTVAQQLQQNNAVTFSTTGGQRGPGGGGFIGANNVMVYWLNRAFDRYVLENADLAVELEEAQRFTTEYLTCSADIEPFVPGQQGSPQEYFQQIQDCASSIDPTYGT